MQVLCLREKVLQGVMTPLSDVYMVRIDTEMNHAVMTEILALGT